MRRRALGGGRAAALAANARLRGGSPPTFRCATAVRELADASCGDELLHARIRMTLFRDVLVQVSAARGGKVSGSQIIR